MEKKNYRQYLSEIYKILCLAPGLVQTFLEKIEEDKRKFREKFINC